MERLTSDFDALAMRFITGARPEASALEVGNAISRLHMQVAAGEIDLATVVKKMQAATFTLSRASSFGDQARACRDLDAGRLTSRERAFVRQMCSIGFNRQPTRRQADWLASILAHLRQRAA